NTRIRTSRTSQRATLFPYTTLFRSGLGAEVGVLHLEMDGARADPGAAQPGGDAQRLLVDEGEEVLAFEVVFEGLLGADALRRQVDRKSTRLNSSHVKISYAVFCLKK